MPVEVLYKENKEILKLKLLAGKKGLKNIIQEKGLHRPGLALTGFVDHFSFQRIQVFGNTEMRYLLKFPDAEQKQILNKVFGFNIPCVIVSNFKKIPEDFLAIADKKAIPVLQTPHPTTKVVQVLGYYLDEKFAPTAHMHGSLVDVYGVGILISGRSGIGKSEVALDLIARGHRLISDDVVTICRRTGGILIGSGNEALKYHMEIRGLGIIDIKSIYGIRGVRTEKRVEVLLELVDWDESQDYERLGLKEELIEILGENIPVIRLPIYPGKNISVIAEVIALNQLLKLHGQYTAKKVESKISRLMKKKTVQTKKYQGPDFE